MAPNTTATKDQYVYVLSNLSLPTNLLKIGWTRDHPSIRAGALYTSGVPTPFVVEHIIITQDGRALEQRIHRRLHSYRTNTQREFFSISMNILTEILTQEMSLTLSVVNAVRVPVIGKHTSHGKKIYDIHAEFQTLKKEAQEVFDWLKNMDADATQCAQYKYAQTSRIYILKDIAQYKRQLEELMYEYDAVKRRLSSGELRRYIDQFHSGILSVQKNLHQLKIATYVTDGQNSVTDGQNSVTDGQNSVTDGQIMLQTDKTVLRTDK